MAEPKIASAMREVFHYADPWPAGLFTGYADAGGFVLESVVTFRRGVLLSMLIEGQRVMGERGYDHVRVRLPLSYPPSRKLRSLITRMGGRLYHEDAEWMDFVWYP